MKHPLLLLSSITLALASITALPVQAADDSSLAAYTITRGRTLEDFFTAAINYSPLLKVAREQWNIGSARLSRANGQLLPQIQANALISKSEYTNNVTIFNAQSDGERYSLSVNQVLFNWQAFSARKQAAITEDQREAEYYAQLSAILTDVADRYLAVLQAEDASSSIKSEIEALTSQIDRLQTLYDLQLARVTDLYAAQARLAGAQAAQVQVDSDVTIARENLRAATGIDVGELSRLPEEITVQPLEGELADWLARTSENNDTIRARALAYEAAKAQVSGTRGAYLPQVSLVYSLSQSNQGFDNIPQPTTENNYIGLSVSVPLYAGGSNRATVREAFSLKNIAESEYRQAELDMLERSRNAYFEVRTGESRISAAKVLLDSTTTSLDAMRRGFELGTVTSVDVLNALRDQFTAERDLQKARYDHIRARLVLLRDSGALSAEDMMEVSAMLNASGMAVP